MPHQVQILIVMASYLVLLILWGIHQGRKVKDSADYAIAGRNLPGWAAALSERATGESAWALLGLPGFAYATGLSSVWTAIGCVAGIVTAWSLLAWRLRREAERSDAHSFSEYLSRRHAELGPWIRTTSSLIIVFFFFFYVGAQFLGGGKTLFTLFRLDPKIGMVITACVIVPYTVYGGFRSVVYTDCVQALLMITTLVVGPVAGLVALRTTPAVFARSIPEALAKAGPSYTSLTGAASGFAAGALVMAGLSWFFGYLGGMPQLTQRFMAIRDAGQARRARRIGIAWTVVAYVGALSIGWIGLALFGPGTLDDSEWVMPRVMLALFPPVVAGILITGAIAAMVSTADSLLILSATELSENLLARIPSLRQDSPSRLARSRTATAVLALVALGAAAVSPSKVIYDLVGYVWAGIGCTFSVVVLLGLFWRRFHGKAALLTMLAGMGFTVAWIRTGMESVVSSRILTFVVSLAVALAATLLIKSKTDEQGA
jgi:sodium/proline symporter